MIEPATDAEKVEWLWKRLDLLNAECESYKVTVATLEKRVEDAEADAARARVEARQYAEEVSRMALELNSARQAAVNAVREYVAATEV